MLFKSLLVRRLEADGSLSWGDIEDLKYIYMNHICQPISQRVQKLTLLFHHCRVHELHNLLHPTSTCPPLLSVLVSHTAAVWGSFAPSLFHPFLLLQPTAGQPTFCLHHFFNKNMAQFLFILVQG